jgi:hypothetical protein
MSEERGAMSDDPAQTQSTSERWAFYGDTGERV